MFVFRRIGKHFSPATAVAVVALVFAVTGGAFSATGGDGGGSSHGTFVASAAKSKGKTGPRGARGPAGPAGKNGTNGAPGAQGPMGPAGATGATGAAGSGGEGKAGESVTVKSITGGKCAEGGTEFSNASGKAFACNGEEGEPGKNGKEGSPWTAGGTLPAGSTETGMWEAAKVRPEGPEGGKGEQALLAAPMSFTVPLKERILKAKFVTLEEQEGLQPFPAECEVEPKPGEKVKGTLAEPVAPKGVLCAYQGPTRGAFPANRQPNINVVNPGLTLEGASVSGATLDFYFEEGEEATESVTMIGSWAVTAPEAP
jgi:Collagen triple helix repeat (20 copies)